MATSRKKAPRTRQSSAQGSAAYRRYLNVALAFPGTEEATAYGTPGVKVKGKILSRLRTDADGALAIHCDFIDREMLLQADPEVFFITDHYKNYPMILIRLDKIRADALPEITERAWRLRAPKRLIEEYDRRSHAANERKPRPKPR